jgi:SAM-dependent methyltransferase
MTVRLRGDDLRHARKNAALDGFGSARWSMTDRDLQAYYARDEERDRLALGLGRVEFCRTIEVLQRTLPPPGAVIADIGGGPGRYTDWLVDSGYDVIHRDLVAHHVDQVRDRHQNRVDSAIGDARALDLADDSVDAVLLLGPLYHLEDSHDRLQALREARRVVRHRGVVHAAAVSRWAPRLHGMLVQRVHVQYPVMNDLIDAVEHTGVMPPLHDASFTGYAHTPDELRGEVLASKLTLESLVGLEGIAFALPDVDERMDDPHERALLFDVLRAVESVPDLLGLGPHLLATARKA